MRTLRFLLLFGVIAYGAVKAEAVGIDDAKISIFFSQCDNCSSVIVKALDDAKSSVRILAYSFTSARIAKAVVDAQKRGISVEVILDKTQKTSNYSVADFLANQEVATRIDTGFSKAHNKIMIIDDKTVITGSFNFTSSAESKNAENLLIIESTKLAKEYLENYSKLRKTSEGYVARGIKQPFPETDKDDAK